MSASKMELETVWLFDSSSSDTQYQTILYSCGKLSCDCPGWRFARNGVRTCKHVRLVELGAADSRAAAVKRYKVAEKSKATTRSTGGRNLSVVGLNAGRAFLAEEGA